MLVLRRRAGESLLIGDEIEVQVLAITPQGAKIGIRAPKETVVLRKELRITQRQNESAACTPPAAEFDYTVRKFTNQLKSQPSNPIRYLSTKIGD
jgi:carbon storage regulator